VSVGEPARGSGVGWRSGVCDARVLALLGAATIAFSGIFVRLSHTTPTTAAVFRCADALPVLFALAAREDRRCGRRSWGDRVPALLSGVFFAGDLVLWNASIQDVGAGLATVLGNIQVVLLPLVAWGLLGERPPRGLLVALPVSGLGVLLISGVLEHGSHGSDVGRGTVLGVGAGVAYVGFLLLLRRGGTDRRRVAGPLCDATAVAGVGSLLIGLVLHNVRLVPTWPSAGWLLLLALSSQVLGWMLISASLPRLPAATASILLTVQPAGSVALAAILLGETPTPLQLGGVVLVLVGLLTVRAPQDASDREPDGR
jgi:drug/metabolite transporter (DMT)-like permease